MAENHRVHDPSGHESEQPRDDQRAAENHGHDPLVVGDLVAVRPPHPERQA